MIVVTPIMSFSDKKIHDGNYIGVLVLGNYFDFVLIVFLICKPQHHLYLSPEYEINYQLSPPPQSPVVVKEFFQRLNSPY